MLPAAQVRLSRGDPNSTEPPPPALWESAQPPGQVLGAASGDAIGAWVDSHISQSRDELRDARLYRSAQSYTLTAVEDGVLFDIDADGDPDRVAWTEAATDVAFLALDSDGDGEITSGRELIGDRTLAGVTNAPNALTELAAHPGPLAMIDSDIPLFAMLRLWRDANHNGRSEASELRPADEELSGIGLGYGPHRRVDGHGNQSQFRGFVHVRTAPGKNRTTSGEDDRNRRRSMYDVCLLALTQ